MEYYILLMYSFFHFKWEKRYYLFCELYFNHFNHPRIFVKNIIVVELRISMEYIFIEELTID